MLMNSPDCSTCLFSWYGLLIMVGVVCGVGGDFSQTPVTTLSCLVIKLPGTENNPSSGMLDGLV